MVAMASKLIKDGRMIDLRGRGPDPFKMSGHMYHVFSSTTQIRSPNMHKYTFMMRNTNWTTGNMTQRRTGKKKQRRTRSQCRLWRHCSASLKVQLLYPVV